MRFFLPALLCIFTEVRCLPLSDVKRHSCLEDASMRIDGHLSTAGCDGQVTDDALTAEERHQSLLEELQELVEHELKSDSEYTREAVEYDLDDQKDINQARWGHEEQTQDRNQADNEEKEESARELEELLAQEIRKKEDGRKADTGSEGLRKTKEGKSEEDEHNERRENEVELTAEKQKVELELQALKSDKTETQEKEEELHELMQKMERAKGEQEEPTEGDRAKEEKQTAEIKEPQQKREMEKASDERTRQFEKERYSDEEEEDEDEDEEAHAESEELLEIEAQLRNVAAELRKLHRG